MEYHFLFLSQLLLLFVACSIFQQAGKEQIVVTGRGRRNTVCDSLLTKAWHGQGREPHC